MVDKYTYEVMTAENGGSIVIMYEDGRHYDPIARWAVAGVKAVALAGALSVMVSGLSRRAPEPEWELP